MDRKVLAVVAVMLVALPALSHAHSHSRPRPSRHVKRNLEEFLEPPPPPPAGHQVVRSRRGNSPPGAPSLGERIARWFYAGPNDGPGGPGPKQHGNKPNMVGLSPPPPPAGPPPGPPAPLQQPHTAEAVALTEQKPPPPHHADQHTSATEHHSSGGGHSGGGGHPGGGYRPQNYPVLMPQSYLRSTDCNPCNNVPWIPMARAHGSQDGYGGEGEAWGQASDAVPLAHVPIPFPALHKAPLPPVFPAEDFTRVPPEPADQHNGLRDHLVPPTPEHESVVFTINEEPIQDNNDVLGGELKSAPDQQHQGTRQHNHALHHVPPHAHHHAPNYAPNHAPNHALHHVPHNSFFGQQPFSAAKGVELVQSVPLASYLASIEYPMTFIQSPLIEIPVKSPHHGAIAAPSAAPSAAPTAPSAASSVAAQSTHYQIIAPTPMSEKHAGSLPLQGEGHSPRLEDSDHSASIQHHNLPPCRNYLHHMQQQQQQQHRHHHHEDAATANSQNSHAYAQDLATAFESHRVRPSAEMTAAPTASTAAPGNNNNNYRFLEEHGLSASTAPPTGPWETSAPSGVSAPASAPAKGTKKTKQIQIIVPYTIDKESGQVRLHSELNADELSGAGAEGLSFTAPPDLPPGLELPAGLPSGLEALVGRKVPSTSAPFTTASPQTQQQGQSQSQPQAQESVVVAELSPTPWHSDRTPTGGDPFAGLQHILAADLRSLLRGEEDSVDRLRLQKNIDNWTAQEYSSLKATRDTEGQESNPGAVPFNFTSTTASMGTTSPASTSSVHGKLIPSKKIPKEYLTTTPLSVTTTSTSTTTTARPTTARRDHSTRRQPAKIQSVRKTTTRDDRKTKNGWTLVDNLVVPGPTTARSAPDNHRSSHSDTEQTRAPWERLQVSISPLTREKVYVVTPLSTSTSEATTESSAFTATTTSTATTTTTTTPKSINDLSPFRQWMDVSTAPTPAAAPAAPTQPHTRPRFSIRPTPGWPKPRPHGFRSSPATERLQGAETTPSTAVEKGVTKASRATPRGFAVETISGHSKVFTATTSTWSKKKAVDSDNKKSTTAKPATTNSGGRTTRALKTSSAVTVTASPKQDLSDIDAEASASVLHQHVAQLTARGPPADPVSPTVTTDLPSTATERTTAFVTPSAAEDEAATRTAEGPEIVIVESRRATTTVAATETTEAPTSTVTAANADTKTGAVVTTAAPEADPLQRTTRAIKTIGRRPDGSRYILSDEEAKQVLSTQPRTKLQVVSTPKKYESPPPRPKPQKGAAALLQRKPSRRPPHLVITPDRGSYLWNFSEFSATSHEDMAEDDMSAIKGTVVELKKEATLNTTAMTTPAPRTTPTPAPTLAPTPGA